MILALPFMRERFLRERAMSDETSLSGLDFESAKAYVFGYLTSLKQLDIELSSLKSVRETWKSRLSLSESKGLADLVSAAQAKIAETEAKISTLEAERAELAAKVARMREQLPMIKATDRSIDTDQLLAELQLATGELLNPGVAATDEALKNVGVDTALDELKRKLSGNS